MRKIGKRSVAVLAATLTVGLGAGALPAAAPADSPAVTISCKKATIGGQRKCIAAGQYCKRKYERDYNKYGYTCNKKDRNGRWHLRKL